MMLASATATAQPGQSPRPESGIVNKNLNKELAMPQARQDKERMMRELNLSDKQRQEVDKLWKEQAKKHESRMDAERKLSDKNRKTAMKEMDKADKRMKKILTKEQYNTWERQRDRNRRHTGPDMDQRYGPRGHSHSHDSHRTGPESHNNGRHPHSGHGRNNAN